MPSPYAQYILLCFLSRFRSHFVLTLSTAPIQLFPSPVFSAAYVLHLVVGVRVYMNVFGHTLAFYSLDEGDEMMKNK